MASHQPANSAHGPASAPPARKVKFVASDPSRGGLPVKRKQVQQACAACRRKKVGVQLTAQLTHFAGMLSLSALAHGPDWLFVTILRLSLLTIMDCM